MLLAGDFRKAARQKLSGFWMTAVLMTLLYYVISSALNATLIGALLLTGPFWYGYSYFMLQVSRWQRPSVGELFSGFQTCLVNSIITWLLVQIFTFLWSLLLVIPGIIKSYSYAMCPYILADEPGLDVMQVIDRSRIMMDGNKWRLFCLDLSFLGWYILAGLTFGIGLLWVVPYHETAKAQFYESIKADQNG